MDNFENRYFLEQHSRVRFLLGFVAKKRVDFRIILCSPREYGHFVNTAPAPGVDRESFNGSRSVLVCPRSHSIGEQRTSGEFCRSDDDRARGNVLNGLGFHPAVT